MKMLSESEDTIIRNRLDIIAHNLYRDVALVDDLAWAHKNIKELLFIIHELQERVSGNEGG